MKPWRDMSWCVGLTVPASRNQRVQSVERLGSFRSLITSPQRLSLSSLPALWVPIIHDWSIYTLSSRSSQRCSNSLTPLIHPPFILPHPPHGCLRPRQGPTLHWCVYLRVAFSHQLPSCKPARHGFGVEDLGYSIILPRPSELVRR